MNPGDLITISHPLLESDPDVTQRDAEGKLFLSGRFEIKPDGSCYLAGTEYYINNMGWMLDEHTPR